MSMNELELTKLFVEYKELLNQVDEKEKKIIEEILKLKESKNISGVKATYYKPSEKINYEQAVVTSGLDISEDVYKKHTKKTETISWKDMAEELGVDLQNFKVPVPEKVIIK